MKLQELAGDSIPSLSDSELEYVVDRGRSALAESDTGWCGGCQRLWPNLAEIAHEFNTTFLTANTERYLESPIGQSAQIALTCILFIDGKTARQRHDTKGEEPLRDLLERYGNSAISGDSQ